MEKAINLLRKEYTGLSMLAGFLGKSPFYILIATILSARNRDSQTARVVKRLFERFRNAKAISTAPIKELEELVKQSGFYKVKARRIKEVAKIIVDKYSGKVPEDFEKLVLLPGVGPKTAGCVMVYAFDKPALPVDTHVHRISNRLGWVKTNTPVQTEIQLKNLLPKRIWKYVNEVFVLHGQNICKPQRPLCSKCTISKYCKKIGVTNK